MDNSHIMIHAQKIKEEKLKEWFGDAKIAKIMILTFQSQGLMDMIILSSEKGFPKNFPLILLFQVQTKIGFLT